MSKLFFVYRLLDKDMRIILVTNDKSDASDLADKLAKENPGFTYIVSETIETYKYSVKQEFIRIN